MKSDHQHYVTMTMIMTDWEQMKSDHHSDLYPNPWQENHHHVAMTMIMTDQGNE